MCISQLKEIAEFLQAVFTILAIIVGGIYSYYLFWKTRPIFPRANITHHLGHRPIANDKLWLHVSVKISNAGDVLISLVEGEVRISKVLPLPPDILDSINKGHDPVDEEEGETMIMWPEIALRESKWEKGKEVRIEPNESDELHYDFIINAAETKTIEIYSHFRNVVIRNRPIGWTFTTFHDLQPHDKRETISLKPEAEGEGK